MGDELERAARLLIVGEGLTEELSVLVGTVEPPPVGGIEARAGAAMSTFALVGSLLTWEDSITKGSPKDDGE